MSNAPRRAPLVVAPLPVAPVAGPWPNDADGILARLRTERGPKETPRHAIVTRATPPALPRGWHIGLGMNMGATTPRLGDPKGPGMVTARDFLWLGVVVLGVLLLGGAR